METTTYHLIFRHPKGYTASAKVKATSEKEACEILAKRKPYATEIRVG